MSMIEEQNKFLLDFARLINYAEAEGFLTTGGELKRFPEMQQIHLERGHSRVAFSLHQKSLAVDLNIFFKNQADKWQLINKNTYLRAKILGEFWENLDAKNVWGGFYKTFIDAYHFERGKKDRTERIEIKIEEK